MLHALWSTTTAGSTRRWSNAWRTTSRDGSPAAPRQLRSASFRAHPPWRTATPHSSSAPSARRERGRRRSPASWRSRASLTSSTQSAGTSRRIRPGTVPNGLIPSARQMENSVIRSGSGREPDPNPLDGFLGVSLQHGEVGRRPSHGLKDDLQVHSAGPAKAATPLARSLNHFCSSRLNGLATTTSRSTSLCAWARIHPEASEPRKPRRRPCPQVGDGVRRASHQALGFIQRGSFMPRYCNPTFLALVTPPP